MDYKEEGERVLKDAPPAVGSGAVDLSIWKVNRPGFSWRS